MTIIIDKVIDKTARKEGEVKKYVVVIGIIVGVLVASGVVFGVYCIADIDGYLQHNKEIINLYDFYDLKVGYNTTAVYFIGSSIVAESVYPPEINDILALSGHSNITVYTAFLSSDTPISRSVQIQNIIDSHPSLIIYGLMPRDIGANNWQDEYISLVNNRLNVRDDAFYLYDMDQLSSLTSDANIWYNKKFLINAWKFKFDLDKTPSSSLNYSYDPLGEERRQYISEKRDVNQIITNVHDPLSSYRIASEVPKEWTQNKEALIYIIETFDDADIPVILVNMPINPLLSEQISEGSYDNYYALFNETDVSWYDLDGQFNSEYFFDEVHMTYDGALAFAPILANLIIKQVENDVIHYS